MVGAKELCALLLAGSMGAGSVVAVQQAKPAVHRAKAKPQKARPAPASVRKAAAPALIDCPVLAAPVGSGLAELVPLPENEVTRLTGLAGAPDPQLAGGGLDLPPVIGGTSGPSILPGSPPAIGGPAGVPQPAAWAMLVSGFGLVGMAMRRRAPAEKRDA